MTTEPYHIKWDDNTSNVLNVTFERDMTWDFYHKAVSELIDMIKKTEERIDVLVLVNGPMPSGNPISHFRRAMREFMKLDNLGLVITVDPTMHRRLIKIYVDLLIKLLIPRNSSSFPFAAVYDEGIALIERDREKVTA